MHTKKVSFSSFFTSLQYFDLVELAKVFSSRLIGNDADISNYKLFCDEANDVLSSINSFILINDLKTMRLLFATPSVQKVTGYTAKEFIAGGIPMFIKNYCPADRVNGSYILNKITAHQKQLDLSEKESYQYITTFRFLHRMGYYSWMYNRMFFLEHEERKYPHIALSIVTGIDYKRDDRINFACLKYNKTKGTYEIEFKEEYQPECLDILNVTELEILKLLLQGMNNSQIGTSLNLSEHTVKHYRKLMLKKTWCDNTAELLCFALRNKLII